MNKLSEQAHRYFYPRVLLALISFEIWSTSGPHFPGRTSAYRKLPRELPRLSDHSQALLQEFLRGNVVPLIPESAIRSPLTKPMASLSRHWREL